MLNHSTRFAPGVILALLATATPQAPAEDSVHLALSGLHLAADKVRGGGDWWGIFPEGDGYTLQPTRVRVEAVVNPLADGDTRKTATQVTVPGYDRGIPLLRGLMSAAAGPLDAIKPAKNWRYLAPGDTIKLPPEGEDAGVEMKIVAEGKETAKESGPSEATVLKGYQLRLIRTSGSKQQSQLLAALPEFQRLPNDPCPSLLWAGDLDRDGKVDLLYDLSSFYIVNKLALFLSSAAKDGELVGLVARWNAVGGC